jgi:V/A-type H+-transporting ATPase subunit I
MGLFIARTPPETIIIVPKARFLETAKALVECGCFHPSSHGDERLRNLARRLRGEVEVLIQRIKGLLERIGEEPEEEKTEIIVTSNIAASSSSIITSINTLLEDIEARLGKLIEERGIGPLAEYVRLVEQYSFITADLNMLREAKHLRTVLYRVPEENAHEFENVIRSLNAYAVGFNIEQGFVTYAVTYTPQTEQKLTQATARTKATPIVLPRFRLTREQVKEVSNNLYNALKRLEALATLLKIVESAYLTRSLAVFVGYVTSDNLKRLKRVLDKVLKGAYTIYARPVSGHISPEEFPVELKVPRPLKPFAELLAMYGLPSPRDFVPLVMMAITFPVIFGLMFPDVGHGLLLLLFGAYLYTKARSEGWRTLGQLLIYVSIPAIILGAMAAEFFGPATPMAHWLEEFWHGHPPYSSPVHALYKAYIVAEEAGNMVKLLTFKTFFISLSIGSVLLALASWLGFAKAVTEREPEHMLHTLAVALAFTGVLVVFIGSAIVGPKYTSMQDTLPVVYAMFGGSTPAGAYVYANMAKALIVLGLLLSLVTPLIYSHESVGERIISAVMEAFDLVLIMLGNTLSFVRIMGLMLAHSGLVYGFFIIADKAGGLSSVAGLGLYIFGNLFVAGFEAFVANIQSLRLHFYEMFSKFYEGRGIIYQPIRLPEGIEIRIVSQETVSR